MSTEPQPLQTFDKLSRDQLEIYAKELREHMQSERQLREDLQSQNRKLEQRIREITALNQLFQKHLDERVAVVQAYREVLKGLNTIGLETSKLVKKAESLELPDMQDLPSLDP